MVAQLHAAAVVALSGALDVEDAAYALAVSVALALVLPPAALAVAVLLVSLAVVPLRAFGLPYLFPCEPPLCLRPTGLFGWDAFQRRAAFCFAAFGVIPSEMN